MNKKTVSKVNLFFDGLVSRMEENKDFFNDITINLKSGTKNFPAKILYTDDITLIIKRLNAMWKKTICGI